MIEVTMTTTPTLKQPEVTDIAHIEIYVSDIEEACRFYKSALGLEGFNDPTRDASRGGISATLQRRGVKLILTAPTSDISPVAEYLSAHGEGVKDIAFTVDNLDALFESAIRGGATNVSNCAIQPVDWGEAPTA